MSQLLDEELEKFCSRLLVRMIDVYLDARYEKVRKNGCVRDIALFTAVGVNENGYREILGISCGFDLAPIVGPLLIRGSI